MLLATAKQPLGHPARDLGDFQRVGQAVVKGVELDGGGDLGDAAQPAKLRTVEYAVTIAGECTQIILARLRVEAVIP
jgi:hypothetical protein